MKRIFLFAILVLQPLFSGHAWADEKDTDEKEARKKVASDLADTTLSEGGEHEIDPKTEKKLSNALVAAQEGNLEELKGLLDGKEKSIQMSAAARGRLLTGLSDLAKNGNGPLNEYGLAVFTSELPAIGQVDTPATASTSGKAPPAKPAPAAAAAAAPTQAEIQLRAAELQVKASETQLKAAELNARTAELQGGAAAERAQTALAQARTANEQARTAQQQAQTEKDKQQAQAQAQAQAQNLKNQQQLQANGTGMGGAAGGEGDKKGDKDKLVAAKVAEPKSAPTADGILKLLTGGSKDEKEGGTIQTIVSATPVASPKFDAPVLDISKTVAGIFRAPAAGTFSGGSAGPATVFAGSTSASTQRAIAPERLLSSVGNSARAILPPGYGITAAGGSSNNSRFIVDNQAAKTEQSTYEKIYDAEVRADAVAKSRGGPRSAQVLETVSAPAGGHKGSK